MLSTLAILIFLSAIVSFFSKEIMACYKKISKIYGISIWGLLIILSIVVERHQNFIYVCLLSFKAQLYLIIDKLQWLIPFQKGANEIASMFYLFLISALPIGIIFLIEKWKGPNKQLHRVILWLSAFLWITSIVFLTDDNGAF